MIYLVRHGRTTFNDGGRFQGGLDSPLTALGLEQAARNGRLLKHLIGSADGWLIQASPLGRTVHTAKILCAELGDDVGFQTDARLAEIRLGEWEGLTDEDIDFAYPGRRDGVGRYEGLFRAPGGETYDMLAARLGEWLAEARADPRPRIAISHGMSGRLLRGLYLGLAPAETFRLEAPQDAVFRLTEGRVERLEGE